MEITTKKDKDRAVSDRFMQLVDDGLSKTDATYKVMSEFNICTPSTVLNIRKRIEGGAAV